MSSIEKAANLAIVVLCAAVVLEIGYRHFGGAPVASARVAPKPRPSRDYSIGERMDRIPGYTPQSGKSALFVVVKSTCGFCRSSMPFYQRLSRAVQEASDPVRLVAVCLEGTESCARFFDEHRVQTDTVVGVEPGTVRVFGTPTLILVDADGIVQSTWRGALKPEAERDVIVSLTEGSDR